MGCASTPHKADLLVRYPVEGKIVWMSDDNSGIYHATLFDPTGNGNNIALGALGGSGSRASSINNYGQIVGEDLGVATLFDLTGGGNNIDLNTLIDPTLGRAKQ